MNQNIYCSALNTIKTTEAAAGESESPQAAKKPEQIALQSTQDTRHALRSKPASSLDVVVSEFPSP